jgi:hypothetical protein
MTGHAVFPSGGHRWIPSPEMINQDPELKPLPKRMEIDLSIPFVTFSHINRIGISLFPFLFFSELPNSCMHEYTLAEESVSSEYLARAINSSSTFSDLVWLK